MDGQAVGGAYDWQGEGDGHARDEQGVKCRKHNQNFTKSNLKMKNIFSLDLTVGLSPSCPARET